MEKVQFETVLRATGHGSQLYVPVPERIGIQFHENRNRRVQCQIDDQAPFQCALQRNKVFGYFMGMGRKLQKQHSVGIGDEVRITIWPDQTKYQAPMPEALAAVIETDPDLQTIFEALTPGRKRSIIYMVSSAKRTETQINRALKIGENLKRGITDLPLLLK